MLENKIYVCGIGAQKAGTTFLADYFERHPQFMMSQIKELHYFDSEYIPELVGDFENKLTIRINKMLEEWHSGKAINTNILIALIKRIEARKKNDYRLYFNYFIKKHHFAFGDITPSYAMLNREHFKKIVSIFPNHKFILLLRNPVDRFWSHLNYELQNNKLEIDPKSIYEQKLKRPDYQLRNNYQRTIEEALSVINKDNLYIEFYENLFSEKSTETMKKISYFIGIDFHEDLLNKDKKINATYYKSKIDTSIREKLIKEFESTYKFISERYNVPKNWSADLEILNKGIEC